MSEDRLTPEKLDELERAWREWWEPRRRKFPEAPWPLELRNDWIPYDKLVIHLVNAAPVLLALARSAITPQASPSPATPKGGPAAGETT